jgi:hypothetical protein
MIALAMILSLSLLEFQRSEKEEAYTLIGFRALRSQCLLLFFLLNDRYERLIMLALINPTVIPLFLFHF